MDRQSRRLLATALTLLDDITLKMALGCAIGVTTPQVDRRTRASRTEWTFQHLYGQGDTREHPISLT